MNKSKERKLKKQSKTSDDRQKNPHVSKTDPLGSYTGVPKNPKETPTQDADDL